MFNWLVGKLKRSRPSSSSSTTTSMASYDILRQPIYIEIEEGHVSKIGQNIYMVERRSPPPLPPRQPKTVRWADNLIAYHDDDNSDGEEEKDIIMADAIYQGMYL